MKKSILAILAALTLSTSAMAVNIIGVPDYLMTNELTSGTNIGSPYILTKVNGTYMWYVGRNINAGAIITSAIFSNKPVRFYSADTSSLEFTHIIINQ
jgi:hypothetical protein